MPYDEDTLGRIYNRTDGRCHICGKKLSFVNYARRRRKSAWEIEHSLPRSNGGTNHLNNLYPACIACNRTKGTYTTKTARGWHGRQRAPLSKPKKLKAKMSSALVWGTIGGLLGSVAGPVGRIVGAAIGAKLGYDVDPDSR